MDIGVLEQQVMLAILRLHPNAYGVSIQAEIESRTKRSSSVGSVYAALERLERKKYIVSRVGESTAERGGRRKLYFALTGRGQITLQQSLQALDSMRRGVRIKEIPA